MPFLNQVATPTKATLDSK